MRRGFATIRGSADTDTMPKTGTKHVKPRQRRALTLLASGETVTETARTLKISPRTLHRWREDKAFRAELDRLLGVVEDETRDRLKGLLPKALNLLDKELSGKGHPAIRAAREVLDRTFGRPALLVTHAGEIQQRAEITIYELPENGRYVPAQKENP